MSHTTLPARAKVTLDWTALQKALVFTKLVYRKPRVEKLKKPARRPVPTAEAVTAAASASLKADFVSPTRHVDAYGETDERLLPWACD